MLSITSSSKASQCESKGAGKFKKLQSLISSDFKSEKSLILSPSIELKPDKTSFTSLPSLS